MALRQLMLSKKIEQRKELLADLEKQETDLLTREKDLEASVDEAKTDEETAAIEEEADKIETDKKELAEKKSKLEGEIADLEGELEQLNSKSPDGQHRSDNNKIQFREEGTKLMNRYKVFGSMTREAVHEMVNREDVKAFLTRAREFYSQSRTVSGAELLVPEVMLDILRDTISTYSKLITKVNFKPVKGKARQNVSGTVPEAVWTEMVGALNELEMSFNQVEVDGYKVGGFVVIPNSTLQDSDVALSAEILTQIGKAIGKALDKAILYGLGTKQPLGIVTRLAQTSKPAGYSDNAPTWVDLHTTHITKTSTTGAALIGAIITAFSACKNNFSDGRKFFAMNSITHAKLVTTLLNFNAAGAIATGMSNQMPVLGGDIVIIDDITDNDIIGGYGDLYLLAEREGTVLASSDQVKFVEDMTVFKGLARYDGLPVIAEGFFVININNASATTTATFETDYANTALGTLAVTSAASASTSGKTVITVTGKESSGTSLAYVVAGKAADVECGDSITGYTAWNGTDEITAATGKTITIVEFDGSGRAIKVGSASVTAKA